jgi:hypothetical protein
MMSGQIITHLMVWTHTIEEKRARARTRQARHEKCNID